MDCNLVASHHTRRLPLSLSLSLSLGSQDSINCVSETQSLSHRSTQAERETHAVKESSFTRMQSPVSCFSYSISLFLVSLQSSFSVPRNQFPYSISISLSCAAAASAAAAMQQSIRRNARARVASVRAPVREVHRGKDVARGAETSSTPKERQLFSLSLSLCRCLSVRRSSDSLSLGKDVHTRADPMIQSES